MAELARAILDGPHRTTSDGTTLVLIKGKWYYANRSNVNLFLREWKEPGAMPVPKAKGSTSSERAKKLDQLEAALLDGKISEKTYKDLKEKYSK
jgi:hypothetical protein